MNQVIYPRALSYLFSFLMMTIIYPVEASPETPEHIIKRYEKYLNASDSELIMTLYGNEPIFMPQNSLAHVGLEKVKKAYDSVFKKINLDIVFTIYEIEINNNTAWARTSSMGNTTILSNGMKIKEGNNELFIFKKEKGKWKIHRYLFSTTTPRN